MGAKERGVFFGLTVGGSEESFIIDVDRLGKEEVCAGCRALTCGTAFRGAFFIHVGEEFERERGKEIATDCIERFHGGLKYEHEKEGGEVISLVNTNKVFEEGGFGYLHNVQAEFLVHSGDHPNKFGRESVFFQNCEHELMVHRVKSFDQVNENGPCLVSVFFSYLQR